MDNHRHRLESEHAEILTSVLARDLDGAQEARVFQTRESGWRKRSSGWGLALRLGVLRDWRSGWGREALAICGDHAPDLSGAVLRGLGRLGELHAATPGAARAEASAADPAATPRAGTKAAAAAEAAATAKAAAAAEAAAAEATAS